MAGGDIFGIGTSGLLAAQRQLATASHNISNVNTEGYSRQRAEQEARRPQFSGSGYIGTGVDVQTTVRLANEFLEEQVRNSNSDFGKFSTFHALSSQIDNILANEDSGLTPTLEDFFSGLQEANDNPSATPSRQVLLSESKTMVDRFQLLDSRFYNLNETVNQELVNVTREISDAARSIARYNVDIVQRIGAGQGDMPNDLIDQREQLIKKISENIDVSVVYQDDGAANLFIGSGQSLVVSGNAAALSTQANRFNPEDLDIILTQNSESINVTSSVTGGELEGIIDFKNNVLEPSRRSLGRIAIALSEEINAQHKLGMSLQDDGTGNFKLGDDFFTDLSGPVNALPGQNTSGEITFTITESRVLTASDYRLDYDGANYTLTRLSDNKTFPPSAPDSLAALNAFIDPDDPAFNPLDPNVDPQGFRVEDPAAAVPPTPPLPGDSFLIRPTFNATRNLDLNVNNVLDVALAAPIIAGAVTNPDGTGRALNTGTGEISLPLQYTSPANETLPLINTTNPDGNLTTLPLSSAVILTFAANAFTITGPAPASVDYFDFNTQTWVTGASSPLPYDPGIDSGTTFVFNYPMTPATPPFEESFAVQIQGTPDDGDSFEITENKSPYDDNRNGLLMSGLQTTKTIENSSSDFQSAYGIIVSDVGTKTHASEVDLLAQQTLNEIAIGNRESYSGVNLDEEAADLLRFQQAYQASARVISIADEMFQTLINSV